MASITLDAHAKVNLFLKVLNKRKDSYHNILTLFERVSIADRIKISKIHKGIAVSSDRFITRDPKDNLVYKAAELLINAKKIEGGVRIEIKKRIPIAAGLGGGSSDAAAVLSGMNILFGLGISKETLVRLGARLGADVPFFMLGTPFAIGRSKGDVLERLDSRKRYWHLIIYPDFKVSTKEIYDSYDILGRRGGFALTSNFEDAKMNIHLKLSVGFDVLESMIHNDLEDIAVSKKKVISVIIKRLALLLGKKGILSGSGPSVFCLCRTRKEALGAKRAFLSGMPGRGVRRPWQVFVARTC